VALDQPVQTGTAEVGNGRLEGVETVVERQQGVATISASSSAESTVERRCYGPIGASSTELRRRHFRTVLGLMP
jgi:hypothetical protein